MSRQQSELGLIVLGCLLYTAGSAILYVLPGYLSEIGTALALDDAQLGAMTAAENIGIGAASILSMLWIGRVSVRVAAALAALACAACNVLAALGHSFHLVIAARFLAGLLGEGTLFALAFVVLRAARYPDRAFGIALTSVVTFGSIVLAAQPSLDRLHFGSGALLPLAVAALAVLPAIRYMPRSPMPMQGPAAGRPVPAHPPARSRNAPAVLALSAMGVWYAAPGAFWTFADTAAASRHVAEADISVALAIGNAVGLAGSLISAWQANRWGRAGPIAIATACLCLAVLAFAHSLTLLALAAALSAFNVFWNYGAVYQMALVAALDPVGRISVAISAAQVFGFAAGGFVSGLVIDRTGFGALPLVVAALAIGGLLLFLPSFRPAWRDPRG
jgi:DHA1 family inner membrane transport protein